MSSILAQYLRPAHGRPKLNKIGLYTSPHLRFVRERIQIDNAPLSEEQFAKYFFEVWDRFEAAAQGSGSTDAASKPMYFRFLTLMALHAYLKEGVDSVVIECGIGGEYDSTNILCRPTVAAVSSLGIDHTAMLGSTLPEIAWHKAGIFKRGSAAFTVPQHSDALAVLSERAAEKNVALHVTDVHPSLAEGAVGLGLSASCQKLNASLAIAVAAAHLRALGHTSIPDPEAGTPIALPVEFIHGLQETRLAGRCDVRVERNAEFSVAWHLDGGHTLESIQAAGQWFCEALPKLRSAESTAVGPSVLIFNQQTRDANALATALFRSLKDDAPSCSSSLFTHVIFTTNKTSTAGYKPDLVSMNVDAHGAEALSVQRSLAQTWSELDLHADVRVVGTIEDAIAAARSVAAAWARTSGNAHSDVAVLITGSLHLVGGALEVLEKDS